MASSIIIEELPVEEFTWANRRYDEVGFVHSDPDKDFIAVALVDGQRAGIGRLVRISKEDAELGGMYVFPEFRAHGLSHLLIDALLERGQTYKRIFYLPFSHLQGLYEQHGFRPSQIHNEVPKKVLEKHRWRNETYTGKQTLLLEKIL